MGSGLLVSASSASAAPVSTPSAACKNLLKNRFNHNYALSNVESDGPYPGATKLQDYPGQGANSTETWKGDSGATLQRSLVKCAPGKIAIGGGFSHADEGDAAYKGLQIVTSRPAQSCSNNGVELAVYVPIPGDKAGSIVPNAWLVEGFNKNDGGELIVRPWVVCATLNPLK